MHILRHAHEVSAFLSTNPDPAVTALVQQRLSELLADDDLTMEQPTMEQLVFFVIPEPGDTLQQLVDVLGMPRGWEEGGRVGDAGAIVVGPVREDAVWRAKCFKCETATRLLFRAKPTCKGF